MANLPYQIRYRTDEYNRYVYNHAAEYSVGGWDSPTRHVEREYNHVESEYNQEEEYIGDYNLPKPVDTPLLDFSKLSLYDTDSEEESFPDEWESDHTNGITQNISKYFKPSQVNQNSLRYLVGSEYPLLPAYWARQYQLGEPRDGARFQLLRKQGKEPLIQSAPFRKSRHGAIRSLVRSSPRQSLVNKLCIGLTNADQYPMCIGDEMDIMKRYKIIQNGFYVPNTVSQITIWTPWQQSLKLVLRFGVGVNLEVKKGLNQVCICNIAKEGQVRERLVQPGMSYMRLESQYWTPNLYRSVDLRLDQKYPVLQIRYELTNRPRSKGLQQPASLESICADKVSRLPIRYIQLEADRLEQTGKRYSQRKGVTEPHILTPQVTFLGGQNRYRKYGTEYQKFPLCGSRCGTAEGMIPEPSFQNVTTYKAQVKGAEAVYLRPRQLHTTLVYAGKAVLHTVPKFQYSRLSEEDKKKYWPQ